MRLAPAIPLDDVVGLFPRKRRRRNRRKAPRARATQLQPAQATRAPAPVRGQAPAARRGRPEARLQRARVPWGELVPGVVNAALDAFLPDDEEDYNEDYDTYEDGFDGEMEGLRARGRRRAPSWGPIVRMGQHSRVQAAEGYRAAVIELKPGLFLVAEMPEAVARPEFGMVPMLAPLMVNAARGALDPNAQPARRQGPLGSLFQRRRGPAVRPVQVRPMQAPAQPAPLALPGPVAHETAMVVAAPNVGWADDHDVATVIGCEACGGGCRR